MGPMGMDHEGTKCQSLMAYHASSRTQGPPKLDG